MTLENAGGDVKGTKGGLSYKYQRLRERLRIAVKSGELTGKLPGERELARRYAANAKTINKALNDLAMEGLVYRHVGRGTFVASSSVSSPVQARARRFAWMVSTQLHLSDGEPLLSAIRESLEKVGHRIETIEMDEDEDGGLLSGHLGHRHFRQFDGALLVSKPSSKLLDDLRRRRMSVVLLNNYAEAMRLPAVLPDRAHGAFVLCQHLVQLGHRRIALLVRADCLPGATAAEAGYRAAMAYYGLDEMPVTRVGRSVEWSDLAGASGSATAFICVPGQLGSVVKHLAAEAGVDVPGELSIAAICTPGEMCGQRESISCYEVEASCVLRWASELLTQRFSASQPPLIVVPGRFIDRGTLAPARDGVTAPVDPLGEARL